MNTPLREELLKLKVTITSIDGLPLNLEGGLTPESIDQILSLVASKMPEKKELILSGDQPPREYLDLKQEIKLNTNHQVIGWNAYHDTVKSILKGGTDE
jgi:hypothetical protein